MRKGYGVEEFARFIDENVEGDVVALDMVSSLPPRLSERLFLVDKDALGKTQKQELFVSMMLGLMESPTFLRALGQAVVDKPLEAVKHMTTMIPKGVVVDGDVRVSHAIVVPAEVAISHWEKPKEDRVLDVLAWTDDLSDTPFGGE